MATAPSSRLGFGFHSGTKWKAARAFFVSVFALGASCFVILSEPHTLIETLKLHPAWFFSGGIFLIFALLLGFQLWRVLNVPFVLEFTESGLVDRRYWRERFVPYEAIEIFSPLPETMFRPEPTVAELRAKLGLDDHLSVSCRIKSGHFSENDGDFMFSERVASPSYDIQGEILRRLRAKISQFDLLVYDLGDDGDDTNA